MVNGILNLMAPKIMTAILEILPVELGDLIGSLPSPTELKGHFEVRGTPLSVVSEPMASIDEVCRACEASPRQLMMFLAMQRYCMERSSYHELKTIKDMLSYTRRYRRNTRIWRNICWCWEQCCSLYCEQVRPLLTDCLYLPLFAVFIPPDYLTSLPLPLPLLLSISPLPGLI